MIDNNEVNLALKEDKDQLIEEIIKYEWTEFDMTQNEGGRAGCQDNYPVFYIMRKSQYLTWNNEMLHEYLYHIDESLKNGRNLITEKYGRMMESTAPAQFDKIKSAFPELSDQRKQIMEAVIQIQIAWMEEFAQKYPGLSDNARSIQSSYDNSYNTSYETYLRGELGTYSDELMMMYAQFIVALANENKNLAFMTMENTVKLYGYESLDDAEAKLK